MGAHLGETRNKSKAAQTIGGGGFFTCSLLIFKPRRAMPPRIWTLEEGNTPLVAAAIHNGHGVRAEILEHLALSPAERRREEDPFTDLFTMVAETRVVGLRSRFEVDLNRPREGAVYRTPDDAWGLDVWNEALPDEIIEESLAGYDAFYEEMHRVLARLIDRHGFVVVYDIHSYNYRRDGPDAPPAKPAQNPEVNVGTGTMDRTRWAPVVERFIADLRGFDYRGRRLDVRENVKFRGGFFPRWIHETFPKTACALAIEFKKFFMNEITGQPSTRDLIAIGEALAATVPGVLEAARAVATKEPA